MKIKSSQSERETRQTVITLGKPEEDKPQEGIEDKLMEEGFEDSQKVDSLVEGVEDNQKVDNLVVEDNRLRVGWLDQTVTFAGVEALPLAVAQTYRLSCPFPPCVVSTDSL